MSRGATESPTIAPVLSAPYTERREGRVCRDCV